MLQHLRILTFAYLALVSCVQGQEVPDGDRLKTVAPTGLKVGGVLHGSSDDWDQDNLITVSEREFSAATAAIYMPWGAWPDQDSEPDTSALENVVNWAVENGKLVHGHSLVYPIANQNLDWWKTLPAELTEITLKQYVDALMAATEGQVWVWDAVNEVMADDGSPMDPSGLRTDVKEYTDIGPDYVDKVFQWANEADSDVLLILNEYGAEEVNNKSDRLLAYVLGMRERGIPIDGVGFQCHFFDSISEPDYESIETNFNRFANAGFKIFITELDVVATRSDGTPPTAKDLQRQARIYYRLTRIAAEQPACESLLFWDFVDERSWLSPSVTDSYYLSLGEYGFPTMFSGGKVKPIVAKPAYYAVQAALADKIWEGTVEEPLSGRFKISNLVSPETGYIRRRGKKIKNSKLEADTWAFLSHEQGRGNVEDTIWELEPLIGDVYRIRCNWDEQTGYLSRAGQQDRNGDWEGTPEVYLDELHKDWYSQRWIVKEIADDQYTIQGEWFGNTGYLTRRILVRKRRGEKHLRPTAKLYLQPKLAVGGRLWNLTSQDE